MFSHGIEGVIHGAALHKPDIARYPAQSFVDVNVTGTLNLLSAAVAAGHDRFVFTSTTSLMVSQEIHDEAGDAAVWLDERTGPLAPRNIYFVSASSGPDGESAKAVLTEAYGKLGKYLSDNGAPWKKLANEKPKGETIAYDKLLNAWKEGRVR